MIIARGIIEKDLRETIAKEKKISLITLQLPLIFAKLSLSNLFLPCSKFVIRFHLILPGRYASFFLFIQLTLISLTFITEFFLTIPVNCFHHHSSAVYLLILIYCQALTIHLIFSLIFSFVHLVRYH